LEGLYESVQNTADKVKKNGLLDFAIGHDSQKQLFITTLRDIRENAGIPGHDSWSSNTYNATLRMVWERAGPACMYLLFLSISPRQFRKLGIHVAAKLIQYVVQNRCMLFCAPLEEQFRRLASGKRSNSLPWQRY
jgi:hypothetical protein